MHACMHNAVKRSEMHFRGYTYVRGEKNSWLWQLLTCTVGFEGCCVRLIYNRHCDHHCIGLLYMSTHINELGKSMLSANYSEAHHYTRYWGHSRPHSKSGQPWKLQKSFEWLQPFCCSQLLFAWRRSCCRFCTSEVACAFAQRLCGFRLWLCVIVWCMPWQILLSHVFAACSLVRQLHRDKLLSQHAKFGCVPNCTGYKHNHERHPVTCGLQCSIYIYLTSYKWAY